MDLRPCGTSHLPCFALFVKCMVPFMDQVSCDTHILHALQHGQIMLNVRASWPRANDLGFYWALEAQLKP